MSPEWFNHRNVSSFQYLNMQHTPTPSDFLSPAYWEQRYREGYTPWNIGHVSPPLRRFMEDIEDKATRILIPGAGHAHEAAYLHQQGFTQVWVCDWAPSAFQGLLEEAPDFPRAHLLVADFFALDMEVDIILEQTFFCAIDPQLRSAYARKAAQLLRPGGILAGLLFAEPFEQPGPPFGGTAAEYRPYFEPYFDILHMDLAPDSIKPRLGRELFVEMRRVM